MLVIERSIRNPLTLNITMEKYSEFYVDAIKKLMYRRYNPYTKNWEIPFQELPALAQYANRYNVKILDPALNRAINTKGIQEEEADVVKKRLENMQPIRPYEFVTQPLPHQIEAFNRGLLSYSLLIADEQGLGKTKESIDIASYRIENGMIHKCLILCGVNSTRYNWQEEIKKHSRLDSIMIEGSRSQKLIDLTKWELEDIPFAIINVESIRDEEILRTINGIAEMVIFDEAHKCKSPKSQRGKALQKLNCTYKLALTGTPMTRDIDDLWNLLTWLGAYKGNYYQFINEFCIKGGYKQREIVGYQNIDRLNDILSHVMLRRKKETVLSLPEKIYLTEYIELTPQQKDLYSNIRKGIINEISELSQDQDLDQERLNPLTMTIKLRQCTAGLLTNLADAGKLNRIKEMLEEEIIPNGHKAIIFSNWESVTSIYREALAKYNPAYIVGEVNTEQRQEEVQRFQTDPNCKVAIGTYGSMGVGLTMTSASYVFFPDLPFTAADMEQAEDRSHRIGTKGNVTIITMIAKDTIDERILEKVMERKELNNLIVDGAISPRKSNKETLYDLLMVQKGEL